jgi:hypothetical protein
VTHVDVGVLLPRFQTNSSHNILSDDYYSNSNIDPTKDKYNVVLLLLFVYYEVVHPQHASIHMQWHPIHVAMLVREDVRAIEHFHKSMAMHGRVGVVVR